MSKAVVYTLLATALFLFIVLSNKPNHKNHKNYGLGRRLGYKVPSLLFDPLVTKMDRLAKENGLIRESSSVERQTSSFPSHEHHKDIDEFLGQEGRLNLTLRLMVLFPLLDKAPEDGLVDFKELEDWISRQQIDHLNYRTQTELESRDKDGDGAISFTEYLPQFSKEDIERNGMEHGEAGWWMEQFRNADVDRNGNLSFNEFQDFLHPEDSKNEEIQKWLLREKIKRMDFDKDGKLNFLEFKNEIYNSYKTYFEFENGGVKAPNPEEAFAKLDVNNDKFLVAEELKPILHYLSPGELAYAKYYTIHLIHEADENRDGKLTLDEMINHEYVFYRTVYEGSRYDDDDDYHDEL
ncbi:uncharacterized protein LOC132314562 [Cornus florida]|uniref:uncharacterized protein LOC132314562 n=1 Tax=Cornus florida TaxID=4283 RepID=UPI0028972BFA|nr:uncharacterized protein LOC132314562 [Cornus florida]